MRKALCVVPVLAVLLFPVLPAWGETPSAPAVRPAERCPAAAEALPELLPQRLFATYGCGSCSDSACNLGSSIGSPCSTPEGSGQCMGLIDSGVTLMCGTLYQCKCVLFD